MYGRALKLLPGGATGWLRRGFHSVRPLVVSGGEGAWIFTVDGERLLDMHMAFGAVILGHSDPDVSAAVSEEAERIVLHGAGVLDLEVEYAGLLSSLFPNVDMVVFTASGSEAVLAAVRAARAYTGRDLIVKFEGNYHGWHDYFVFNVKTPISRGLRPESGGVPGPVGEAVAVLPYNSPETLESFMAERGGEVAAIIVEPVAHSMGVVPASREFILAARRLCKTYGCLLVFDEIITGIRCGLRGLQEYYGVDADLITLGKAIANGLPVAALGGKREFMALFEDKVVSSGTFAAHPLSMAGGIAALKKAVEKRVDRLVSEAASQYARVAREALEESRVEAAVSQFGGSFSIHIGLQEAPRSLSDALKADTRAYRRMVESLRRSGVLVNPDPLKRLSLSMSHGDGELELFSEAVRKAAKALKE